MGKITATHVKLLVALKGGCSISEAARFLGTRQPPTSAMLTRVERTLPFAIAARPNGAFQALNADGEMLATALATFAEDAGAAAAEINKLAGKTPLYSVDDALEALEARAVRSSNKNLHPSLAKPYHAANSGMDRTYSSPPLRISAPIISHARDALLLELIAEIGSDLRCTIVKHLAWTDTLVALATREIDLGMCRSADDGEPYPDGYDYLRMQDDPYDRIVIVNGQPDLIDGEGLELSLRHGVPAIFPSWAQPHLRLALEGEVASKGAQACFEDDGRKFPSGLVWMLTTETIADEPRFQEYFEQRFLRLGAGIDLVYRSGERDSHLLHLLDRVKQRLI